MRQAVPVSHPAATAVYCGAAGSKRKRTQVCFEAKKSMPTRCANRDQRIHPHRKLLCQKAEKREERKRLEMQQENEDPRNQNASKWVKFKWEAICSDRPIGGE